MRARGSLAVALVAMGVAAGSVVMAEEGGAKDAPPKVDGRPRGESFKQMDTDGNGTVSLAEFTAMHEKRVQARKEKMGDKWDEAKAAKMPSAEERFKKADKDGNGELTPEEMKEAHGRRGRMQKGPKPEGAGKEACAAEPKSE